MLSYREDFAIARKNKSIGIGRHRPVTSRTWQQSSWYSRPFHIGRAPAILPASIYPAPLYKQPSRLSRRRLRLLSRIAVMESEIGSDLVGNVQVDDPVHEVEAGEADWEDDAGILVNRGR